MKWLRVLVVVLVAGGLMRAGWSAWKRAHQAGRKTIGLVGYLAGRTPRCVAGPRGTVAEARVPGSG